VVQMLIQAKADVNHKAGDGATPLSVALAQGQAPIVRLLLEKVNLQSEGINQREKMLQRERDFGELRSSMSGKGVPEDVKSRVLGLHEDNVQLREHLKTVQDKLTKARTFIKSQDKLFKEEQAKLQEFAPAGGILDESDVRSQVRILEDELKRHKRLLNEAHQRYRKEQELLLSAIHSLGMYTARNPFGRPSHQQGRALPMSWLGQQRQNLNPLLHRQ